MKNSSSISIISCKRSGLMLPVFSSSLLFIIILITFILMFSEDIHTTLHADTSSISHASVNNISQSTLTASSPIYTKYSFKENTSHHSFASSLFLSSGNAYFEQINVSETLYYCFEPPMNDRLPSTGLTLEITAELSDDSYIPGFQPDLQFLFFDSKGNFLSAKASYNTSKNTSGNLSKTIHFFISSQAALSSRCFLAVNNLTEEKLRVSIFLHPSDSNSSNSTSKPETPIPPSGSLSSKSDQGSAIKAKKRKRKKEMSRQKKKRKVKKKVSTKKVKRKQKSPKKEKRPSSSVKNTKKTTSSLKTIKKTMTRVQKLIPKRTFIKLKKGQISRLTVTILPRNASNKKCRWKSSSPRTVSVHSGIVTAKKPGLAVIVTRTKDGSKRTCSFTVKVI